MRWKGEEEEGGARRGAGAQHGRSAALRRHAQHPTHAALPPSQAEVPGPQGQRRQRKHTEVWFGSRAL